MSISHRCGRPSMFFDLPPVVIPLTSRMEIVQGDATDHEVSVVVEGRMLSYISELHPQRRREQFSRRYFRLPSPAQLVLLELVHRNSDEHTSLRGYVYGQNRG
jgi:hypothetical protein